MSAISLPPPPRAASSANPPTTGEHYAALSALHSHYRALVASERKTMVQERQLWEDERMLYIRRIEELENAVRTSAAPPAPPKQPVEWSPPAHQPATREWAPPPFPTGPTGPTTTTTTTAGASTNAAPAAISAAAPQQENSRPAPSSSVSAPAAVSTNNSNRNNSADNKPALALDDNDDDDEEEISPEEMAQLLREATRIVYPISQVRPRGRSLAEPAHRRAHAPVESEAEDGSGEEEVELKLKKTSNFGMDFGKMDFGRWR